MTHPLPFVHQVPPVTEDLFPVEDFSDGVFKEIGNLSNNVDLWSFIDSETSPDSDGVTTEQTGGGTFLTECGSPTDAVSMVVGLNDFTDPPSGVETFTIRFRARLKETNGSPHQGDAKVELLQGASTVIHDTGWKSLSTSFQLFTSNLSLGAKGNLLSDTSDMRLRLSARGCVDTAGDEADVEHTLAFLRVVA